MIFVLVRMWFNDLSTEVPTGHRYLWASENKTIRNSEFLYETCFDDWHCMFQVLALLLEMSKELDLQPAQCHSCAQGIFSTTAATVNGQSSGSQVKRPRPG